MKHFFFVNNLLYSLLIFGQQRYSELQDNVMMSIGNGKYKQIINQNSVAFAG